MKVAMTTTMIVRVTVAIRHNQIEGDYERESFWYWAVEDTIKSTQPGHCCCVRRQLVRALDRVCYGGNFQRMFRGVSTLIGTGLHLVNWCNVNVVRMLVITQMLPLMHVLVVIAICQLMIRVYQRSLVREFLKERTAIVGLSNTQSETSIWHISSYPINNLYKKEKLLEISIVASKNDHRHELKKYLINCP